MNLSNLLIIGPATTKIMRERKHQGMTNQSVELEGECTNIHIETRDGKKSYDSPPHSKEMTRLNRQFGRVHGVSLGPIPFSVLGN